jgi:DEAD/DEAH box helicase domain-containing protein
MHEQIIKSANELVSQCACLDGCPSCVGPGGENGAGGKMETHAILEKLVGKQ